MNRKEAIFTIEGELYVEGVHIPQMRWNGWAMPSFPLESVEVIAKFLAEQNADYEQGGIVVMVDGVPHWKDLNDEGVAYLDPITPYKVDGVDLYDIGSGCWCWDDVTVPDFGDDEESHAYWLGEIKDCQYKSAGVLNMIGGK